jgi:hypothetical protein
MDVVNRKTSIAPKEGVKKPSTNSPSAAIPCAKIAIVMSPKNDTALTRKNTITPGSSRGSSISPRWKPSTLYTSLK